MSESTPKAAACKPRPEDVESPDAIIKAMYESLSGPAGDRNWRRERSLFMEGALLIPIGKRVHRDGDFQVMSLDDWIADASEFLAENDFYESEIMRKTFHFGDMVAAFSTYEARNKPDEAPIARGINSIQLVFNEGRWWILSVMWDNETKENPIPEEFLPYLW
jgi:hypothetical protein